MVVNTSDLPLSKKTAKKLGNPPIAADLGFKGISFPRWLGVHPDTPDDIADAISVKFGKLLKAKSVRKLIKKVGEEVKHASKPATSNPSAATVSRSTQILNQANGLPCA